MAEFLKYIWTRFLEITKMCNNKNAEVSKTIKPTVTSVELDDPRKVSLKIDDYLFGVLGMDTEQASNEKRELIKDNFVHLMCLVIKDLQTIEGRLNTYKIQRKALESDKSNGAEYKRRKLEYFAKQNRQAKEDIVEFLNNGVKTYLLEEENSTLECELGDNELGKLFLNGRYSFSQFPEYYDAEYDYATMVKASYFPDVELVDSLNTEKKYMKLRKDDEKQYYTEIKRIIKSKNLVERVQKIVDENYHLHRRHEIFDDLVSLYKEEHYQSFLSLGLIQIEGLFYDICSIKYGEKENAGTLVEKAERALRGENEVSFMRYYPYFAFDVPIMRNEIAHTGLINATDLERKADELILDLNAVTQMAKMESDGKFRVFHMIYEAITTINNSTEEELNKKLVCELFYSSTVAPDSFWDLLRTPEEYKDELDFYKKENLPEGYVDLPTVVKTISDMVRELPFWCAMVELMNKISSENDSNIVTQKWKELLLKLAKSYVKILEPDAKEKCIEILATLQSN